MRKVTRSAEVGPIALRFQSKDKLIGLPAIPDLPAEETSRTINATACDCSRNGDEIDAIVVLAPAAVGTNVETGPIVDRRDHRGRRFGVGCLAARSAADAGAAIPTNGTQQELLHSMAFGLPGGPDTTLTDCAVGAGASVVRAHADHAEIGPGVTVGPFAYLRPGTRASAGAKIGTFVETKNADIGPAPRSRTCRTSATPTSARAPTSGPA